MRAALLAVSVLILLGLAQAREEIKIVSTTETFASITREIAGDEAEIFAVAAPKRDIHFYAPTPKDVLKVKKAEVFIHGGLDLEQWRDPLLIAAGNPRFLGRGRGAIDVSRGIPLLEIPGTLARTEGDVHLYGNPHYWLDPVNGKRIAFNIAEGLAAIFPERAEEFLKNAEDFEHRLDVRIKDWTERLAPYRGMRAVTYHRSWSYLASRFGMVIAGEIEPKPGIPPTAKHLVELIRQMKEKKVRLILKEFHHESRTPAKLALETGAKVLTLAQAVGEGEGVTDYPSLIEYNVRRIEEALRFSMGEKE